MNVLEELQGRSESQGTLASQKDVTGEHIDPNQEGSRFRPLSVEGSPTMRVFVQAKSTNFFSRFKVTLAVATSPVALLVMKKNKSISANPGTMAGASDGLLQTHIEVILKDTMIGLGCHALSQLKEFSGLVKEDFVEGILLKLERAVLSFRPDSAGTFAEAAQQAGANRYLQTLGVIGAVAKVMGPDSMGSPLDLETVIDTMSVICAAIRRTQEEEAAMSGRRLQNASRVGTTKGESEEASFNRMDPVDGSALDAVLGRLDAGNISTGMVALVESLINGENKFVLHIPLRTGLFAKIVRVVQSAKSPWTNTILKNGRRAVEMKRGAILDLDVLARVMTLEATPRDIRLLASGGVDRPITSADQVRSLFKNTTTIGGAVGFNFWNGGETMLEMILDVVDSELAGLEASISMSALIERVVLPNIMAVQDVLSANLMAQGEPKGDFAIIQDRFKSRLNAMLASEAGACGPRTVEAVARMGEGLKTNKRPAEGGLHSDEVAERPRGKVRKIAFCKPFLEGVCKNGDNCMFNHKSASELKTEYCPILRRGQTCTFGQKCVYAHALSVNTSNQVSQGPVVSWNQVVPESAGSDSLD